jgi:hypothetical protein
MKRYIISLLMIFCFCLYHSVSEDKKSFEQSPAIKFLIEEKMKITPEQIIEYLKTGNTEKSLDFEQYKKDKLDASNEVVISGDPYPESEVHAVINPTDSNNIIVSPIRMDYSMQVMDEMMLCPIYYTKDFGNTWHKSSFKNKPLQSDRMPMGGGDPMMVFDKDGRAYMSWIFLLVKLEGFNIDSIINSMHWIHSSDGGINWIRERDEYIAETSIKYGSGFTDFYDKQWMACDYSESEYSNNVYLCLTHLSMLEGYNIKVYRKENGSLVFDSSAARVNHNDYQIAQFTNMDVDNNGYVHVIFYGSLDGTTNSIYHSVSKDGGRTFEAETKISDFIFAGSTMIPGNQNTEFIGLNPERLYPCPQIAIDKSFSLYSGDLYVTWTAVGIDSDEGNYLDIYLSKSTDGGQTWSDPKIVNDDEKSVQTCQYYSNVSVNPNGTLILSWYDRRDSQNDRYADYYMAYSFDGGSTFKKNFKVSTMSTDFSSVGNKNQNFGIGEYNMLLSTKGYAIPVWSDGRTQDGNMNIYVAFVDITEGPVNVIENIATINGGVVLHNPVPNPAEDNIKVSFSLDKGADVQIFLTDIRGRIVVENPERFFNKGTSSIDIRVQDLAKGEYFVNLIINNAFCAKKIIKK